MEEIEHGREMVAINPNAWAHLLNLNKWKLPVKRWWFCLNQAWEAAPGPLLLPGGGTPWWALEPTGLMWRASLGWNQWGLWWNWVTKLKPLNWQMGHWPPGDQLQGGSQREHRPLSCECGPEGHKGHSRSTVFPARWCLSLPPTTCSPLAVILGNLVSTQDVSKGARSEQTGAGREPRATGGRDSEDHGTGMVSYLDTFFCRCGLCQLLTDKIMIVGAGLSKIPTWSARKPYASRHTEWLKEDRKKLW